MKRFIAVLVLSLSGVAITAAYAHDRDADPDRHHHWAAPEIDPSSAIAALTLLLGGVAVMRSRIGRK
jgi:predicted benzoate:H+ symporter BenE